jgi:hypothetical protein
MVSRLICQSYDVLPDRAERLVGTWRLVSASASTDAAHVDSTPYGAKPEGVLTYTSGGWVTAIIRHSDRKPLSTGDRISAPPEERTEAFATFFAYAGRYAVTKDRVIHHVEISSAENWVGTDMVRIIQLDGDRMTLATPPLTIGNQTRTFELVWKRVTARRQ